MSSLAPLPVPAFQASNTQLSPSQASFVYWLNGLAPVATNIVTPFVVFLTLTIGKNKAKPALTKYNQQVNEVVRQFVSGTIGLLSYFGGGELTKGALNQVFDKHDQRMSESSRQVAMMVGGVAMSFIGFAFVRPYISTDLICRFLKQEKGLEYELAPDKVRQILNEACPTPKNLQKGLNLLEETLKQQASQQAGVKSDNYLIRWLQGKLDQHLLPGGKPDLKKTAIASTVALSSYLALLTGALWGVNQKLGKSQIPPTTALNVQTTSKLMPNGKMAEAQKVAQPFLYSQVPVANLHFARGLQAPLINHSRIYGNKSFSRI
jgi:hypothetical protein